MTISSTKAKAMPVCGDYIQRVEIGLTIILLNRY
jgi:hypothetical protein